PPCRHPRWRRVVSDRAGGACAGISLLRAAGIALGEYCVACARRAGLPEFCLLGMGHLRRLLRVHGGPASDDSRCISLMWSRRASVVSRNSYDHEASHGLQSAFFLLRAAPVT